MVGSGYWLLLCCLLVTERTVEGLVAPREVVVSPSWRILRVFGVYSAVDPLYASNEEQGCHRRYKIIQFGDRCRYLRSRSSRIHDDLEKLLILSGAGATCMQPQQSLLEPY